AGRGGSESVRQNTVHHGRQPRHRAGDRPACGPRWGQHRGCCQNRRTPSEARRDHPHGGARDRTSRGRGSPARGARARRGGRALPLVVDVRDEAAVVAAVRQCAEHFGGIDVCINNASAINLASIREIDMRRYDLIQQINTRGTFVTSRACLPYLEKAANPHILTLSPPLDLRPKWFAGHLAYSLSKYGMSLCMLGLAEEFRATGIACNSLWPRTTIATAAVEFALGGPQMMRRSRKPEIVADAAHVIVNRPARECTGQFFIDDKVLFDAGVRDFDSYSVEPGGKLLGDIFVDAASPAPP